jgi:hypothetical protein
MAWLSDIGSGNSAASRLSHAAVPYVLVNGTVVANDWAGLTSGTLLHAIDLTEQGGTPPTGTYANVPGHAAVWTDTDASGQYAGVTQIPPTGQDCDGWSSSTDAGNGTVAGNFSAVDRNWTDVGYGSSGFLCSMTAAIYCVGQ